MKIRLGTRGSKLALTQSNLVKNALENLSPEIEVELVEIKTIGDRKQGTKFASNSDKRDWIYELEKAVKDQSIDLAVHSGKDIPVDIEEGSILLPVMPRANPYDAFIGRFDPTKSGRVTMAELPDGAKIGTASPRRQAQLLRKRSDFNVVEHRGNVPTRLKKMDESEDILGIVLASAGLDRLEMKDLDYEVFNAVDMLPAVNQGILVVQYREDDAALEEKLLQLVDQDTHDAWVAERAVAKILEGDCKSAIGIFAECRGGNVELSARVMSPDGIDLVEVSDSAARADAHELGLSVGSALIEKGADKIIAAAWC